MVSVLGSIDGRQKADLWGRTEESSPQIGYERTGPVGFTTLPDRGDDYRRLCGGRNFSLAMSGIFSPFSAAIRHSCLHWGSIFPVESSDTIVETDETEIEGCSGFLPGQGISLGWTTPTILSCMPKIWFFFKFFKLKNNQSISRSINQSIN